MSPVPALVPLLIPMIPSLVAAILDVVDQFQAAPDAEATTADQQAALAKLSADLHDLNERIQAAPLPGADVPIDDEPKPPLPPAA